VPTGLEPEPEGVQGNSGGCGSSAVYYHNFEAILRLGRRMVIRLWIEEQLELPQLARKFPESIFT